jgi:hypothetical protein
MNTQKIFQNPMKLTSRMLQVLGLCLMVTFVSCQKDPEYTVEPAGDLKLSVSSADIMLEQKFDAQTALKVQWTTGSNDGNGASISYELQLDKTGNNFAGPLTFDMGKAVYEKSFTVAEMNQLLTDSFGITSGDSISLDVRIIATIHSNPETTKITDVAALNLVSYKPVSSTLYLIGSASPNGWSAENALALTPKEGSPTIFEYRGALGAGEFKFITTLGQYLPSYNKGTDETKLFLRILDSDADDKFTLAEGAVYKIVVDLLELTISTTKLDVPAYSELYMVGSATPNGWDIGSAFQLVQDADNPFIFRYMGVMAAGEFKFPVNRNSDWGQDMFMRATDSTMYLHHGGDADDNKWTIESRGFYTLTLNLSDLTIDIHREELYMVGSATPIGWDIVNAVQLTADVTDGCMFIFEGPMVEGEFKFPVNRRSDWGQDMYMRTSDTEMYRHKGGESDDNKWTITTAGNYRIVANIETLAISIQQQ